MARLLNANEVNDFLWRHPVIPSQVPPAGLIFNDLGRKIVIFKKVDGTLLFSDASDLAAVIGLENQFPDGVPGIELTKQEGQFIVASMPAIIQNAIKETATTLAGGVAAGVDFTGKAITSAAVGLGKGAVEGSGAGTLLVLAGIGLVGFVVWKSRVV